MSEKQKVKFLVDDALKRSRPTPERGKLTAEKAVEAALTNNQWTWGYWAFWRGKILPAVKKEMKKEERGTQIPLRL